MFFKHLCMRMFYMKVDLALEGDCCHFPPPGGHLNMFWGNSKPSITSVHLAVTLVPKWLARELDETDF